MENLEQQMPVQQSAPQDDKTAAAFEEGLTEEELRDFERTQELFEYEMTQVLLNFRLEISDMKKRTNSEYLNMEVPKASVDYSPPEIQLRSVAYTDQGKTISLSVPQQQALDVKAAIVNVPTAQTTALNIPEIPALSGSVIPEKTMADIAGTIGAAVNVPDNTQFNAAVQQMDVSSSGISIPDTTMNGAAFAVPVLTDEIPAVAAEVPEVGKMDAALFSVGKVDLPKAEVNVTQAITPELSAIPKAKDVSVPAAGSIPDMPSFAEKDNVPLPEVSVPVGEIVVVAIPELMTEKTVNPPVISVSVAEAGKWAMPVIPEAADVTEPDGLFSADVKAFEMPAFPAAKTQSVEYPDIPGKPDFSDYYSDIFETLKAEM